MKNTKAEVMFCKILFAVTFILSCLTMNSDHLSGYFSSGGNAVIFTRYALIIMFVFIASIINRNRLDYLSRLVPCSTVIITALLIFDYYVTKISGSQFLYSVWWIGAIFIANATVFITITLFGKNGYKAFYNRFWIGFTPIYLFLIKLCFFRAPFGSEKSLNLELGNGTFLMLKAFLNNFHVSFEAPLIFFGNLLIFIPVPFILSVIFKKIKEYQLVIIGILIPFVIEGYQYFFECGNTDIDDIVLNIGGFVIGYIIYRIIKKTRL